MALLNWYTQMEGEKRERSSLNKERCHSFITKLWEADTLAMFHHPVSTTEVPGYYDAVEYPMDLSTIRSNIDEGKYTSDSEVEDDVVLMISNALEFNERGSQWYNIANELKKSYRNMALKCGLSFDEDQVFIPSKKFRDEESTLRKAELRQDEKLEEVLDLLEKDKEIPLEELRAMYSKSKEHLPSESSHASGRSSSTGDADISDDDSTSESSYDEEEEEEEDSACSDSDSDEE